MISVVPVNLDVCQRTWSNAEWVITPENAVVFGGRADYHSCAEPLGDGPIQQRISRLAVAQNVWILIGSMPISKGSDVMTTSVLFNPQGIIVAHYDKLHMFDDDDGADVINALVAQYIRIRR